MAAKLSRRDFLKLTSLVPAAYFLPSSFKDPKKNDLPNIIVLVFDAWSAKNISLYGYPRKTTPNLDRLADKAIVYHNHYAAGHYTIPGTAGVLTGVLEYQHHLTSQNPNISQFFKDHNIFSLFPDYNRIAYSHNLLADDVLGNMVGSMDELKPWQDLYLWANPVQSLFFKDNDLSSVGWIRTMDTTESGAANSIFLSRAISYFIAKTNERYANSYPLGLPGWGHSYHFLLEEAIDWLAKFASTTNGQFLNYFHLFPPHDPYHTRVDFYQKFNQDGIDFSKKPEHFLSDGISHAKNRRARQEYDEYILYVDEEISRLFTLLESSGSLENTWVFLTSDHGEIFERGLEQHKKPSFFDPLIKVPLVIFPPGQENRQDIYAPTSAIDILPTLCAITQRNIPDWGEGVVLPPFNTNYSPNRPIFVVDAKFNKPGQAYENASFMLRKGEYKLIHHFGKKVYYEPLEGVPLSELYDLENDPEEVNNLFDQEVELGQAMLQEIFDKLREMGVVN